MAKPSRGFDRGKVAGPRRQTSIRMRIILIEIKKCRSRDRLRRAGGGYPLLRRPAASPLIVRWIARWVRSSVWPARCRRSSSTCRWLSGSRYGNRLRMLRASVGLSSSRVSLTGDRQQRPHRAPVLGGDAREHRLAHAPRRAPAPRSATPPRGRSWRAPSPCSTARCGRTATSRAFPHSSSQARRGLRRARSRPRCRTRTSPAASAGTAPS